MSTRRIDNSNDTDKNVSLIFMKVFYVFLVKRRETERQLYVEHVAV